MSAMILPLRPDADVPALLAALRGAGLWASPLSARGEVRALSITAQSARVDAAWLARLPGVEAPWQATSPHPKLDAQPGTLTVGGVVFGGAPVLVAGPCAAESEALVHETAASVARAGARVLRGGAFKPRTSPYSFDGHGAPALRWLREAADAHGMLMVTEALSEQAVDAVAAHADLVQIGSRNMQNFALLHAVGRTGKPVCLKRGRSATLDEWRQAAEHLLAHGAAGVVFIERGIAGADPELRNTLDLAGAALLKHVDGHVVLVDPSHACGRRDLVAPLARAALAAGLDGVMVEVHPNPAQARSDGPQALTPAAFEALASALLPAPEATHG